MTITDGNNLRIVQWKIGDTNGQVVAGDHSAGNRLDQLNHPTDVILDKETNSLIICDQSNRRIVRWSHRRDTTQGEILIGNISCWGLAMDNQKYLYFSDYRPSGLFVDPLGTLYVTDSWNNRMMRWPKGEKQGSVIVGGNGAGAAAHRLSDPTSLSFDQHGNLYIADSWNHRIQGFSIT